MFSSASTLTRSPLSQYLIAHSLGLTWLPLSLWRWPQLFFLALLLSCLNLGLKYSQTLGDPEEVTLEKNWGRLRSRSWVSSFFQQ